MKKDKENKILYIVFAVIGVIFILISNFLFNFSIIKEENIRETNAVILDINDEDVLILYRVDGVLYKQYLNSYSSSYYEGQEIIIKYDVTNPEVIMDDTNKIISYIFGGMGSIFLLISIIIIVCVRYRNNTITKLKETGYIINANYLSTKVNKNYTVNNKHPYNIFCEWNGMDGKKHIFKSDNIWVDPEKIIKDRNIKTFRVYFNPNNIKQYYVEVDMLTDLS